MESGFGSAFGEFSRTNIPYYPKYSLGYHMLNRVSIGKL